MLEINVLYIMCFSPGYPRVSDWYGSINFQKEITSCKKSIKDYTDLSKALHTLLDIYFTPEVSAQSCATGNGLSSKPPLDPVVIDAIKGTYNCFLCVFNLLIVLTFFLQQQSDKQVVN